ALGLPPIPKEATYFLPLPNGNYVAESISSGVGGAITFGDGTTGISGEISASNSLMGVDGDLIGIGFGGILTPCGQVGENTLVPLPPNGDYLLLGAESSACSGATSSKGITIASGKTGAVGTLPISSTFIGTVKKLTNGNYAVAGATSVTLIDGATLTPINTLT